MKLVIQETTTLNIKNAAVHLPIPDFTQQMFATAMETQYKTIGKEPTVVMVHPPTSGLVKRPKPSNYLHPAMENALKLGFNHFVGGFQDAVTEWTNLIRITLTLSMSVSALIQIEY